jgi:hypothetical protein
MNKQKGEKRAPAYLTGIVNMLIEANAQGCACDFDPRRLTTVTRKRVPLRTAARRVDGAFPSAANPIAVWEIKEYYHTTTFGSRVADGIYESLLDGVELEELREQEGIWVKHYLMLDGRYTWWDCGRSYLCRIIDMLHMGYVDEVLFGREVRRSSRESLESGWHSLDGESMMRRADVHAPSKRDEAIPTGRQRARRRRMAGLCSLLASCRLRTLRGRRESSGRTSPPACGICRNY